MKALIFDSGPLINLSMNGLLYILESLKKTFEGKFLITDKVKYEVIDRPIKAPQFEFGALTIKNLLDKNILEPVQSLGINLDSLKKQTIALMNKANNCIESGGRQINIVSEAEISCLALSLELSKRGINNFIAIDERTTRMLTEKPQNLAEFMSKKLHTKINLVCNLDIFKNFRFIRSTELVYVAYKKGFIKIEDPNILEAVLYATKFHGSSVSFEEINILKKL